MLSNILKDGSSLRENDVDSPQLRPLQHQANVFIDIDARRGLWESWAFSILLSFSIFDMENAYSFF